MSKYYEDILNLGNLLSVSWVPPSVSTNPTINQGENGNLKFKTSISNLTLA